MKDEVREKLSAYLDGALSDSQRRAVEVEVERSEELRRELDDLRSVSEAVKGLGKEKLPEGFLARLQARRAREEASPSRRGYRPLALALSTAVIALVVWDRARHPRELLKPLPDWDGGGVALQSAAPAPAEPAPTDALEMPAAMKAAESENALSNKEEVIARQEPDAAPLAKRSARNFAPESATDGMAALSAASAPSRRAVQSVSVAGRRSAAAKVAPPAEPPAPVINAFSLRSAAALQAAWTAAGLTGKPPAVDFTAQMAIFLSGPPGCGIVSVQDHNTSIVVLYRDSGFTDAFARVRAITPSSKPITAKPAN